MTEQDQRIAIATFCGWQDIVFVGINGPNDYRGKHESCRPTGSTGAWQGPLPDYTRDLNAMHEAEAKLSDYEPQGGQSQREDYALTLLGIVGYHKPTNWGGECVADFFRVAHATAAQRAEALLRCLNLWKGD